MVVISTHCSPFNMQNVTLSNGSHRREPDFKQRLRGLHA